MRTPPLPPAEASWNFPLPRPPAWIWLFTTQTGPPSVFAATSESAARSTGTPREIGTPNSCSSALAWSSWMFIWTLPEPSCGEFGIHISFAAGIPYTTGTAIQNRLGISSRQCRPDCEVRAGLAQPLPRADRLVECLAVLAGQFDLDNTLDPFRSDHSGDADIHVL